MKLERRVLFLFNLFDSITTFFFWPTPHDFASQGSPKLNRIFVFSQGGVDDDNFKGIDSQRLQRGMCLLQQTRKRKTTCRHYFHYCYHFTFKIIFPYFGSNGRSFKKSSSVDFCVKISIHFLYISNCFIRLYSSRVAECRKCLHPAA